VGLLGPGKGIEWAIDALAQLRDLKPRVKYIVAGNTHPKVFEYEGDVYRNMLIQRAKNRKVDVEFDPEYRSLASLARLISEASIVILPYDSPDQVTSGVLVDAIAAGRPVIATAFPHAVELLSTGAGIVVPRQDPPRWPKRFAPSSRRQDLRSGWRRRPVVWRRNSRGRTSRLVTRYSVKSY